MKKKLLCRLDKALNTVGLVRKGAVPSISYDYTTKEIHIFWGKGWTTYVHGFVCPTPDGPLKVMTMPSMLPPNDSPPVPW